MESVVTSDWSKFGNIEIEEAKEYYYCFTCSNANKLPDTPKITGEECNKCKQVKHCNTYNHDILCNGEDKSPNTDGLGDKDTKSNPS